MKDDTAVVLLVEDNPHHAEMISRLLGNCRIAHSVQHVSDGEAALDYLYRRGAYADDLLSPRPQLVLLDLRLPVLHTVQKEWGYVPLEGIEMVARMLGMPPARAAGVMSFYPMFHKAPVGRHVVQITILRGGQLDALERV